MSIENKKLPFSLTLSRQRYVWGVLVVLFVAALLRFYKLGVIPHGMTWDEAAIGYNGYSILTTRRDEWLVRLPVSFWSFGDYKAPLAIYLNGFFTFLFGLNLFGVRVPFALASIFAIFGVIRFTQILLEKLGHFEKKNSRFWALLAGILMTLSPWHLHYSRAGFESGLALTAVIWAAYFFVKAMTVKKKWRQWADFSLSVFGFVAAVYAYHSAKIAAPLLALLCIGYFWKTLRSRWQPFLGASVAGLVLLGPFVYDSLFGKGLERAGTLIFSQGYSVQETFRVFLSNLAAQVHPSFWVLGETTTLRHGDGRWGVVLFTTFVVLILGAFWGWRTQKERGLWLFSLSWTVIGFLPALLGTEVPHSNRALLALPGVIILSILGLRAGMKLLRNQVNRKIFLGGFLLLHALFFVGYLSNYYTVFAQESTADFQDGYLEAFEYVIPYEKGEEDKPIAEKIIFTNDYGQAYIYALFARKTNPIYYHGGSLIKYEFKDEITIGDVERKNVVVVASSTDELLSKNDQADHIIYGADGSVRFRIYLTFDYD